MSWFFEDETSEYSEMVLSSLAKNKAVVPVIWPMEVANVFVIAERKKRINEAQAAWFVKKASALPIKVDDSKFSETMTAILPIAKKYSLSAYDASYLELAIRLDAPLATLDGKLKTVAKKLDLFYN